MPTLLVLKHIACEGPGRLADFASRHGVAIREIDLENGEPLPKLDAFSALIVLGGPMNVYEEERFPFLAPETELIREALRRKLPILGLCLGGQLLAKAAGGRVTKNPVKEIGNFSVNLTQPGKQDPLFYGFAASFPVFQWHGDTFSDVAYGVVLASSPLCAHQAFRVGENAYGLQFHVEITLAMARSWLNEYDAEVVAEKVDMEKVVREFEAKEADYAKLSDSLFTNFFRIANLI